MNHMRDDRQLRNGSIAAADVEEDDEEEEDM